MWLVKGVGLLLTLFYILYSQSLCIIKLSARNFNLSDEAKSWYNDSNLRQPTRPVFWKHCLSKHVYQFWILLIILCTARFYGYICHRTWGFSMIWSHRNDALLLERTRHVAVIYISRRLVKKYRGQHERFFNTSFDSR